ncbi:MAG: nucleotidyltransferase family protein [Chitinivibrionales bacterium]|nr:nucleotidyltransferase family protein [Chitinivibrionales bacterium]
MTKSEVINLLRRELPYLHETFGLSRIGLFGSFATGRQTDDSDVDLVLEFERTPGMKFVELTEYIEHILRRKIDALTDAGISAIRNERIAKSIRESVVYV